MKKRWYMQTLTVSAPSMSLSILTPAIPHSLLQPVYHACRSLYFCNILRRHSCEGCASTPFSCLVISKTLFAGGLSYREAHFILECISGACCSCCPTHSSHRERSHRPSGWAGHGGGEPQPRPRRQLHWYATTLVTALAARDTTGSVSCGRAHLVLPRKENSLETS